MASRLHSWICAICKRLRTLHSWIWVVCKRLRTISNHAFMDLCCLWKIKNYLKGSKILLEIKRPEFLFKNLFWAWKSVRMNPSLIELGPSSFRIKCGLWNCAHFSDHEFKNILQYIWKERGNLAKKWRDLRMKGTYKHMEASPIHFDNHRYLS